MTSHYQQWNLSKNQKSGHNLAKREWVYSVNRDSPYRAPHNTAAILGGNLGPDFSWAEKCSNVSQEQKN